MIDNEGGNMIAIIDYGVGNLRSVQKAFEFLGYSAIVTNKPDEVIEASHVVLPGVGAFGNAMESLKRTDMIDTIFKVIKQGKPFLGICLGMQLLFDRSFEGGIHTGLQLIPGEIKKIPEKPGLKIPHMGWNKLTYSQNPLFEGLGNEPYVYFVHSYYLKTQNTQYVIGTVNYGNEIPVAVNRNNIFGLQFHPEKSGNIGLQIIKNFGGIR